jgi:signal peptidase II
MNDFQSEPIPTDTNTPALVAAPRKQQILLFLIAGSVIVLDQLSKWLVEQSLAFYEVWAPIPAIEPYFRLMHATNTGAVFGLFQGGGPFFAIMALIVSVGIIYYNHTLPAGNFWLRVALGLTLGGALGNLIDRFRLGHVTDFLDFGPWPVFNVADMAVVGGAILLGWLVLQESRQQKREEQVSGD